MVGRKDSEDYENAYLVIKIYGFGLVCSMRFFFPHKKDGFRFQSEESEVVIYTLIIQRRRFIIQFEMKKK